MDPKTILITGCNGLIGEVLTKKLVQNDSYNVIGTGRSDNGICQTITIDFASDWNTDLLPDKVDVIIHLAQSEKFRDFPQNAVEVFNINTVSTQKLLDHAHKAGTKKFIYASSGGVYGTGNNAFKEDSPVLPAKDLGFYLNTKACSESLVENYRKFFEVNIIRPFFVYGPKQRKDMLIPRLVESIKNGIPIKLQGEEGIKINPIFVDDAANAIERLISFRGINTFNIAGNEVLSLKEIALKIEEVADKKPVFEYNVESSPSHLIADIGAMRSSLSAPATNFSQGICSLIKNENFLRK